MFIAILFTVAKTWKQLKCLSTDECIKMCCVCTYTMERYSAIKKNDVMSFAATQMDIEIITLSKPDKDTYHMALLIYVIFKKMIQRNLCTK